MNDEWEKRYRTVIASSGDVTTAPMALLARVVAVREPGSALDLACGLGRNALWLAAHGWHVTAVDRSETAISELRRRAESEAVHVDCNVADLEAGEFDILPGAWDCIVICNYYQPDLYALALRGLAVGGVLVASALLVDDSADDDRKPQRFRVRPGELRGYFEDCEVLHYEEGAMPDAAGHRTAEIAVQRLSN